MGAVVALIILAVGIFAFFVTIQNIPTTEGELENTSLGNVISTGNQVFNVMGVVLIIGAIMAIVGLVYSFMRPSYRDRDRDNNDMPPDLALDLNHTDSVPANTKTAKTSSNDVKIADVKKSIKNRRFKRRDEWGK